MEKINTQRILEDAERLADDIISSFMDSDFPPEQKKHLVHVTTMAGVKLVATKIFNDVVHSDPLHRYDHSKMSPILKEYMTMIEMCVVNIAQDHMNGEIQNRNF